MQMQAVQVRELLRRPVLAYGAKLMLAHLTGCVVVFLLVLEVLPLPTGVTPLQLATNLGFVEGVDLLVRYDADPDQANETGETPLISAVHRRNVALVRILLSGGADPDRPDSSGRSARDYAKLENAAPVLGAMDAHARAKGARASGPVYGPKL